MLDILNHKFRPRKALRERDTGRSPAATNIDDGRKAGPIECVCQWFHVDPGCKATHGSSKAATSLRVQTQFIVEALISVMAERPTLQASTSAHIPPRQERLSSDIRPCRMRVSLTDSLGLRAPLYFFKASTVLDHLSVHRNSAISWNISILLQRPETFLHTSNRQYH